MQPPPFLFVLLIVLLALLASDAVLAAPDDEVITVEQAVAQPQQFNIDLDANLFPGAGNADTARQRLEAQIELRLAELDRICQLTDDQKQKLQLAARGDLERFMIQVEEVRKKFDAVKHDQNAFGQVWQEIQPLREKQARGLTGGDSLMMKVLSRTLDPEQAAQYQTVMDQRRQFRYRACVATSITMLEKTVALRHEQRETLNQLLLEETEPPLIFGQYDQTLILYRLSTLPQDKVQPLFDDRQWRLFQQQVNRYRGMRATLVQQGVLPREAGDALPARPVPQNAILEVAP